MGRKAAARKPKRVPRSRKNLLPNEYRKRSTVYVERMRRIDEEKRYGEDDLMTTDSYIVQSHRLDNQWDHTVELRGELFKIPGKVIDRLNSQRDAIIKEGRSDRARDTQERIKAQGIAQADQQEAEQDYNRA
ncbi:hypothetical protein CMI37_14565 [Candidatus Pacearchaeota archaeon]|nr:hypothetical protein [Candidatus Pacearchaeota archaeon]